jgi:GT2 family glycosyltransferase
MTVPIIIPCLNRFDMLAQTINSIDCPTRLYIIDNWNVNRGVSGSWNEGMRRAAADGYKHAMITNDDVVFTPGSIMQVYEAALLTGSATASPNQRGQQEPRGIIDNADMFCFVVDIEQLTTHAGWFDENLFPAYFEDNDMHYRMRLAGLRSIIHTDAIVDHIGSATQNKDISNPITSSKRFEEHRAYYKRKWGGEPGSETFTTPFGNPALSCRDWNGSHYLDDQPTSPAQQVLDTFFSDCPAN